MAKQLYGLGESLFQEFKGMVMHHRGNRPRNAIPQRRRRTPPAGKKGGGGTTLIKKWGLIVGKLDEDFVIEKGTWEKETDKRWFKPPAKQVPEGGSADDVDWWSIELQECIQDELGRFVHQFAEGVDEEENPIMVPVTFRALYIEDEKITIAKSTQEMKQDYDDVTDEWVDKPDDEVEIFAHFCVVENGEIKRIFCDPWIILKEPPPVPPPSS